MSADLEKVLSRAIPALCAVFRVEVKDALMDGWLLALDGEAPALVEAALLAALREKGRKFMPLPGEVIQAIHGNPEDEAIAAWPKALEAIRTGRKTGDQRIDETLRQLGGLDALGDRRTDEREWTRKEFLKAFGAVTRTEKREELPKLGAGAIGRIGS